MANIKHIEIAGTRGSVLQAFYKQMFGWNIKRQDVNGHEYYNVADADKPSTGIRHEPTGKAEIVIYIEVKNVEQSVKKAQALGASVRIQPMQQGDLIFALIEDIEGNPIGLTQAQ